MNTSHFLSNRADVSPYFNGPKPKNKTTLTKNGYKLQKVVPQKLERWDLKYVRPPTFSLRGNPLLVLHMKQLIKHLNKGYGVSCYQMRYF